MQNKRLDDFHPLFSAIQMNAGKQANLIQSSWKYYGLPSRNTYTTLYKACQGYSFSIGLKGKKIYACLPSFLCWSNLFFGKTEDFFFTKNEEIAHIITPMPCFHFGKLLPKLASSSDFIWDVQLYSTLIFSLIVLAETFANYLAVSTEQDLLTEFLAPHKKKTPQVYKGGKKPTRLNWIRK